MDRNYKIGFVLYYDSDSRRDFPVEWLYDEKNSTDDKLYFMAYDSNLFPLPDIINWEPHATKEMAKKMADKLRDCGKEVYLDGCLLDLDTGELVIEDEMNGEERLDWIAHDYSVRRSDFRNLIIMEFGKMISYDVLEEIMNNNCFIKNPKTIRKSVEGYYAIELGEYLHVAKENEFYEGNNYYVAKLKNNIGHWWVFLGKDDVDFL